MKTPVTRTVCAATFAFLSCLIASIGFAGGGKFDPNTKELTLNVYFDYREDQPEMTGKWTTYYKGAADRWYDAMETNSRIKRIYLYNKVPEGKTRADVMTRRATSWAASATLFGFGRDGAFVNFNDKMSENNGHHLRTLTHELGHYMFGLHDSYGGRISDAKTGAEVPVPYLSDAARGALPTKANYRDYMWSRPYMTPVPPALVSDYAPVQFQAPLTTILFGTLSGRRDGNGNFTTPSIMNSGDEFSTPLSRAAQGEQKLMLKFGAYDYRYWPLILKRPADKRFTLYKLESAQEAAWHKSEWEVIAESEYFNDLFGPGRRAVPDNLQPNLAPVPPEIIIIDGSGIVICLDRSGSMDAENRIGLARLGAKATVNLLRVRESDGTPGHLAGVTSFDTGTQVNASVREILGDATRGQLNSAIDGIVTAGATSIGGGLRVSLNALLAMPNPAQKNKTIILLSDGQQNSGEHPDTVIPELLANDVRVYTIALGSDADRALLSSIAAQTGGRAFNAYSPLDLARYFYSIFSDEIGSGSTSASVELAPGETYLEPVSVEAGTKSAIFSVLGGSGAFGFQLIAPNGNIIAAGSSDVLVRTGEGQRLFEVRNPAAGTWHMSVSRAGTVSGGPFTKDESPDLAINDNASVFSTLNIQTAGAVGGLKVAVDIVHTYVGDLTVTLTSPGGTSVVLHQRSGGSADNIQGTYGLDLAAAGNLAAFDGQSLAGQWTLTVNDGAGGDVGALRSWAISYGADISSEAFDLVAMTSNPGIVADGSVEDPTVQYPEPVIIHAGLNAGGPVAGAAVTAIVSRPDGSSTAITLRDDGDTRMGDIMANDGIYSVAFSDYAGNGTYDFTVRAKNVSGYIGGLSEDLPPQPEAVVPFERSFALQATVSDIPEVTTRWLSVSALQSKLHPTKANADSVKLTGSFNIETLAGLDPANDTVTFQIGQFERTFPGGVWTRKGRTQKFVQKRGFDTATIDYFLGGSSRSNFTLSVSKADLDPAFGDPDSVPIRLIVGNHFNGVVTVNVDGTGSTRKLGSEPPDPLLFIDTLSVLRNFKKPNADQLVIGGRLLGDFRFDPAANGIRFEVGDFMLYFPAGSLRMPSRGSKIKFSAPVDGLAVTFTYDVDKGVFSLRVAKGNFYTLGDSLQVGTDLEGITDASWDYLLDLNTSADGRSSRY